MTSLENDMNFKKHIENANKHNYFCKEVLIKDKVGDKQLLYRQLSIYL